MDSFVGSLSENFEADPEQNVFVGIWKEYEKVIVQSLITSFCLDFLVQDQYGGDVDTIHNVRKIDTDPQMTYKNVQNEINYENRGAYDPAAYHQDSRYIEKNRQVSESRKNGTLTDAYTGGKVPRNARIDIDHTISAKEIHDDRGRVLAGCNGVDLANDRTNLNPTDSSINRSKKDISMSAQLQKWEAERPQRQARIKELKSKKVLSDKESKELNKLEKIEQVDFERAKKADEKSREKYNATVSKYYTSAQFLKDTAAAADKRGAQMGMRQAMGVVFVEIWFSCKTEIQAMPSGKNLSEMLDTVADGVKKGVENAKAKYKEILSRFGEGFIAGSLASLTTTLCNIFFTTAKNVVRFIRQIYASVVEAGKILLFNPDNLIFGERIKMVTVILATGASVIAGSMVGELVAGTPIGEMPQIGDVVVVFCSSLVSGLLSCTLLTFLDRSAFINQVVDMLNKIPSEANDYKELADEFEKIAAGLENLDIEKFHAEAERYKKISLEIGSAATEEKLNDILQSAYKTFDIKIPWEGDFDTFMGNPSNHLVFG